MEALRVRGVRLQDLDDCYRIETAGYNGAGATRERIERRIRTFPEGFLVGEVQGHVAGFINSGCFHQDDIRDERLKDLEGHYPDGRNLVVFSLVVDPEHRGRGYSRVLMESFIERARGMGKATILLVCREHLLNYYRGFGFLYRAPSALRFGGHAWHEMALPLASRGSRGGTRVDPGPA